MISFHQLHHSPNEQEYVSHALAQPHWSGGGGRYNQLCKDFLLKQYGFKNTWLTNSCTAALEAAAMLLDIKAGDEIILPSYTYVGTATPFIREGATLVFADSRPDHPNMSFDDCVKKITAKTKAIVLVHYGGVAHDMEKWVQLAKEKNIYLIEDAAHCMHAFYNEKPLGSFGHISAFSFHATKNISCGEGGLLVVNDEKLTTRAQIIMDKGTNRSAFQRGEVNAYQWVDKGSSLVLSEILCALLLSQLEIVEEVTSKRLKVWQEIYAGLTQKMPKSNKLPGIPAAAQHNGHIFYITSGPQVAAPAMIEELKLLGIHAVGHYQSLHNSPFIKGKRLKKSDQLLNSESFTNYLVRLPCHGMLGNESVKTLINNNLISI